MAYGRDMPETPRNPKPLRLDDCDDPLDDREFPSFWIATFLLKI